MTATTLPQSALAGAAGPTLSESRIDADSHFNGLYRTLQNLRIEGVAEGEIQCEGTLTVAEGARVKAKVTASTITIAGELRGEVVCRGIFQIMPTGEVEAMVSAGRLVVQEGGLYNGEFHMITDAVVTESRTRHPIERAGVDRTPAAASETEVTGAEAIGSDEWWAKISGREAAADDSALDDDVLDDEAQDDDEEPA